MNLRKQDLIEMYNRLSIGYNQQFLSSILKPTGRGGVLKAADYIHANAVLAELNKVEDRGQISFDKETLKRWEDTKGILHPTVRFRLNSYTPMLAERYDSLKPDQQKYLFESKKVLFTLKMNGVRGWFIHAGGVSKVFSRNYSQKDCSLPEYWGNILQDFKGDKPFAIDCEIMFQPDSKLQDELEEFGLETNSKLEAMSALLQMNAPQALALQEEYKRLFGKDLIRFRLISVLFFNGVDYRKKTIGDAYKVEEQAIAYAKERGLNIEAIPKINGSRAEKEAFLETMLEHGEEGIVAHFMDSPYVTSENRSKTGFVKIKRSVSQKSGIAGMGDTIDGFVTGFTMSKDGTGDEGLIGSYEVSCYVTKADGTEYKHVIAYVPNIPREEKVKFTIKDADGNPTLDPMIYGLVVEVAGQNISRVSKRLTHPRRIGGFRFDKTEQDCKYTEQFLISQMDCELDKL